MKRNKHFPQLCLIALILVLTASAHSQNLNVQIVPSDSASTAARDSSSRLLPVDQMWSVEKLQTDDLIAEDIVDFTRLISSVSPRDQGSIGQLSPL
ncbi:hypothetical protein MJD09_07665, partial [bacterium]|nr:hypothetical protein [bacterium]